MSLKKIGILHGRERTFPEAFIESINSRRIPGIIAEEVSLGGTSHNEPQQYAVIVDRMSHEVKYYRGYLKLAALNGTRVINNPFWWSADDKFFGTALCARLGVAVPKTILLPNRSYPDGVVPESLHNLKFPVDWEGMLAYVGLPAIIKPAEGGGGKSVTKIHSLEDLWDAFNKSGDTQMMLQECIEWEHYVRCLCVGQEKILPIKWHPPFGRMFGTYFVDHEHLTPELGARVVRDALTINRALGYDMNTVEFAIRDGIPYAIDFTNPAPDFDRNSITDHYFYQIVEWMTDLAISKAQEPGVPQANLKWWSMMGWNEPVAHGGNGNGRAVEEKKTMKDAVSASAAGKATTVARAASASAPARPAATASRPAASQARPASQPAKSAPQQTKPAQTAARPASQPAKPAPQQTKPAQTAARPASQPAKPAPQQAKPAQTAARPASQPAKPAPQQTKPAQTAARPAYPPGKPAPQPAKPAQTASKPAHPPAKPAPTSSRPAAGVPAKSAPTVSKPGGAPTPPPRPGTQAPATAEARVTSPPAASKPAAQTTTVKPGNAQAKAAPVQQKRSDKDAARKKTGK